MYNLLCVYYVLRTLQRSGFLERQTYRLKIAGEEYRVVSEEDEKYIEELAHDLDIKMASLLKNGRVSTTQAAVLCALDYADEAKKNGSSTDNLRSQLKSYLEDAAQAKSERDFYKREAERLKAAQKLEGKKDPTLW